MHNAKVELHLASMPDSSELVERGIELLRIKPSNARCPNSDLLPIVSAKPSV
jgi:hypothetical protein